MKLVKFLPAVSLIIILISGSMAETITIPKTYYQRLRKWKKEGQMNKERYEDIMKLLGNVMKTYDKLAQKVAKVEATQERETARANLLTEGDNEKSENSDSKESALKESTNQDTNSVKSLETQLELEQLLETQELELVKKNNLLENLFSQILQQQQEADSVRKDLQAKLEPEELVLEDLKKDEAEKLGLVLETTESLRV